MRSGRTLGSVGSIGVRAERKVNIHDYVHNELQSHRTGLVCLNILGGRQSQEAEVGVAMNGTRAMLRDLNLPPRFWAEVRLIFMDLCNRTPMRANDGITPDEHFYGMKPDVDTYTPIMHVTLPSEKLPLPLSALMAMCLTVAFSYSLNLQAAMEIRCSSVEPGAW